MIATTILVDIPGMKGLTGNLFAKRDCFHHGAVAIPPAADVVDLAGAGFLEELMEGADEIGAVDVVANLLFLVPEDGIGGLGDRTLHQVGEKTMQLGARMIGSGQAATAETC